MPRATSAACEALPPSEVRIPLAAWKPATSSASVNGRTRITSRPSSAAATASAAVKTTSPLAAPGEALTPRGEHLEVGLGVERRVQERVERARVDRRDRLLAREQLLLDGVDREPHRRLRRALGVAGLEHEQLPLLDRELRVLHVLVVRLERAQDLHQLLVRLGQLVGHLGDVERVAHAGDDVLALGVDEEVAAGLGRAGDLVAAERHAGARRVALVAEHHLLDVDRGAPVVGDAVHAPVGDRALAGPGVEHRADRLAQLLLRVLRELVEPLEGLRQLLQRVDVELGVVLDAAVVT